MQMIYNDLQSASEMDRAYYRYLTLQNLYNAGDSDRDLDIYRAAVSKLFNSLSTNSNIRQPAPVDSNHLVLRIDLRDYNWPSKKWELLAAGYPYGIRLGLRIEPEIAHMAGSEQAFLRADWFTFASSQPPLYEQLLDLPSNAHDLETSLGVNVLNDIRAGRAKRSGFAKSGVAKFNRLIERHSLAAGAYWKSYDFSSDDQEQNLFQNPLGPVGASDELVFKHAGGELIWNLPNGLQAYLLVKADGTPIPRAPDFVHDKNRPQDSAIINGISCIGCHDKGMNLKPSGNLDDEIKPAVLKTLDFTDAGTKFIQALYPDPAVMKAFFIQDTERFKIALRTAHADVAPEPVSALYNRFLQDITLSTFSSEFGIQSADLQERLQESDLPALRFIGARLEQSGVFPRKSFIEQFQLVVEGLKLGSAKQFNLVKHEEFFPTAINQLASEQNGNRSSQVSVYEAAARAKASTSQSEKQIDSQSLSQDQRNAIQSVINDLNDQLDIAERMIDRFKEGKREYDDATTDAQTNRSEKKYKSAASSYGQAIHEADRLGQKLRGYLRPGGQVDWTPTELTEDAKQAYSRISSVRAAGSREGVYMELPP